jgi:hypothetical protein
MNTATKRKLTIMLDTEVYLALQEKVGGRGIGAFLSALARPYVVTDALDAGYKAMSLDAAHEAEVKEWVESDVELADTENTWQF